VTEFIFGYFNQLIRTEKNGEAKVIGIQTLFSIGRDVAEFLGIPFFKHQHCGLVFDDAGREIIQGCLMFRCCCVIRVPA
jgi:hypothetical protein